MESDHRTREEGIGNGPTGEPTNATNATTNDAASMPTICVVCQQPIGGHVAELPRGEPAHSECTVKRDVALSSRTPTVE